MDMNVALKIAAGVTGQQAVDQLKTSLDRMGDSVQGVAGRFGMLKGAVGALAGSAIVAGFSAMIKGAIDAADNLNDLSQKTGIAVEDLDALGFVAEQSGTNIDAVGGALGKLAKTMAQAAGGNKEAVATFRQFGISQQELKNGTISTTEALARIAEKIEAMPDGWQKTAAAQQVFGKSAAEMVPLLNSGAEAIRNARAQLEGYGALFTGGFARAADEFNDNLALLRRQAGAFGLSIAKEAMPALLGFVRGITEAKTKADDLAGDVGLATWAETIALAIAALVDVVRVAGQAFSALIGSGRAVLADLGALGSILSKGPAALFSDSARAELKAALDNRNAIVADANQRYIELWKMDGSKFFNAVKDAMDKAKKGMSAGGKGGGGPGADFDFGAGKETEFDKLKQQLQEMAAKTGDMTEAEKTLALFQTERYRDLTTEQRAELLRLAKIIDFKNLQAEAEKDGEKATQEAAQKRDAQMVAEFKTINDLRRSKQAEVELLQLESQRAGLTAREYEKLVEAKRHELAVSQAVADMLPENAARYRQVADALFASKQAVEQLNYQQSRTFETGARRAFSNYLDEVSNVAKATQTAFENAFQGMEDALVDFAMTGKLNFRELASSIIRDMIRIAVQQSITGPLAGALGGAIKGLFGGGYGSAGQTITGIGDVGYGVYEGGGYTGNGARSGGIDGKGGFMAVLHPQETVIDHYKGQQIGGGTSNNVVVNVSVENGGEQVKSNDGAGQLGRVIAAAVKNELIQQKRPGGLLAA